MRETNGNFDSCNSCKRLVPSRLHELYESKFPFVSRIEFILSKLSNFSAHVSGVSDAIYPSARAGVRCTEPQLPAGLDRDPAAAATGCVLSGNTNTNNRAGDEH